MRARHWIVAFAALIAIAALRSVPPISPRGEPPLPPPRDVRMGFAIEKYTGFDEYVAELSALRDANPSRVTTHSDRTTYSGGYPLYWVTLGDTRKPAILIVSVLHARHEWQGAHLTLAFLRKLLDPEDDQRDFNSRLLDQLCVIAIPMVNVWGYFASPDGVHHNNHGAPVAGIERADWHDMTNYRYYHGVNLNRNFDWNWDAYPSLPWSVRRYWNGSDYGFANYFMMPFHLDEHGNEVFDPENAYPNHILKPDAAVFDYKGEAPFSEPETQLVRDLFARYRVAGFIDVHLMNSWHSRNASYISRSVDREWVTRWVDDAIAAVNRRNRSAGAQLPATQHIVMEEYDGNAPYSVNWAQNEMRVRSFAWETGTAFPEPIWTDAYMEMFYRAVSWMQTEAR